MKYPALSANIQHQSNKPLADDSVSAGPPGELRENLGKLVEQMMCRLSQLANTLTTYTGDIDIRQTFVSYKTSWVIAENIILIEMGLKTEPRPHVTISIRL